MMKYLFLLCIAASSFCTSFEQSCAIIRSYGKIKQFRAGDNALVGIEDLVEQCIAGDQKAYEFIERTIESKVKNDLFDVAIVEQAANDNDLTVIQQKISHLLQGIVHNCHHITQKPHVFYDYVRDWILSGKLRSIVENKYIEKQSALAVIRAAHLDAKL